MRAALSSARHLAAAGDLAVGMSHQRARAAATALPGRSLAQWVNTSGCNAVVGPVASYDKSARSRWSASGSLTSLGGGATAW